MPKDSKILILGNEECYLESSELNLDENFDCIFCFNTDDLSFPLGLDFSFVGIYFDYGLNDSQSELMKITESFKGNIPLLIISEKYDEYDKVLAYRLGALDVIDLQNTPSFLLIEKVRSLVNNVSSLKSTIRGPKLVDVVSGHWEMQVSDLSLTIGFESFHFTRTEFKILSYLLENCNELVEKKRIKALFGQNISDRCLSVHLYKIRKKLGQYGESLRTKVGKGIILKTS